MEIISNPRRYNVNGVLSRVDGIPTDNCKNLIHHQVGTQVKLNWEDPGDTIVEGQRLCSWAGTRIVRKANSFPMSPLDGYLVVDNKVLNKYQYEPLVDTVPSSSVEYFYRAFPYTVNGVFNLDTKNEFGAIDYAFILNNTESNPDARITYKPGSDCELYKKAYMDFTTGLFNYGDWKNPFFMPKPCMLTHDGDGQDYVDYYLNPYNYKEKLDGSASDATNTGYNGNVMIEFPQVWMKYEIGDSPNLYVISISNKQKDSNYHCYTHYNKDGDLIPYIYRGAYDGSYISNRTRCISGQAAGNSQNAQTEITWALANGAYYYTDVLCDRLMINNLLMLISCSTDSQGTFGNGNYDSGSSASDLINSGLADDKGLFWGTTANRQPVKVFGIENWWANVWLRTAGYINASGQQLIKLTQNNNDGSTATNYNLTGEGYIPLTGYNIGSNSQAYIKTEALIPPYGLFPYGTASGGSSSTYYCDGLWSNTTRTNYAKFGGSTYDGLINGCFCCFLNDSVSYSSWSDGSSLTCKPKLSA